MKSYILESFFVIVGALCLKAKSEEMFFFISSIVSGLLNKTETILHWTILPEYVIARMILIFFLTVFSQLNMGFSKLVEVVSQGV